ncbi:MAG: MFS transporter [Rhodoferax sp.]
MNKLTSNRLVCVTIFVLTITEFLQSGMTVFAAAPIMGEVGMGPQEFSLVAAVYASLAILAISMQRWWVERIGGRSFLQLSAVVSVTGSLLCATSHTYTQFLLGRAVMGLGGGAFFTAARMLIQHKLAGPQRFVGIRFLATGVALSIAAAPWLASVAVSQDTWSAIYVSIAGLGVCIFLLAGLVLDGGPRDIPHVRSQVSPWRQLLLLGASFALLYALQSLYYDFYGNIPAIALMLTGGLAGLALYLYQQQHLQQPLLRVREMWSARYLGGMAAFGFAYLMLGANNYVVPIMLQRALGFAWQTVGEVEAVGLAAALLTWFVVSRVLPRHPSPRKFFVVGFLSLALSGVLLARVDTGTDLWLHVLPALALNSVFLLTVLPVSAMQTFREVDHDESVFSHAQQLKNMMAQAGIALGIALAAVGQQWRGAVHYETLAAHVSLSNPNFVDTLRHLEQALGTTTAAPQAAQVALAQVAQMVSQQSTLLASIDHFGMIAVLGVLGALIAVVQRVLR